MLSEVIIIYVNKYAMTTCNKESCQTWWKKKKKKKKKKHKQKKHKKKKHDGMFR